MNSRFENLTGIIKNSQPKLKEQIASTLIKETCSEKGEKNRVTLCQSSGGQPLTVNIGCDTTISPNISNKSILTAENMIQIQTSYNHSQNTTCGIASMIRSCTNNRKFIEPNFKTENVRSYSLSRRLFYFTGF